MTFRRVVSRSGLQDGDYSTPPQRHQKGVITNGTEGTLTDEESTKLARFDSVAERCDRYENDMRMLAGDLRRLEKDAVDENAVCKHIAARTGIDADVVAAVLKEFITW